VWDPSCKKTEPDIMQVGSIIDQTPMQSMQWRIFLASGIGWGFDMFAFTSVSILLSDAAGLYGLPGNYTLNQDVSN
jgi:hypothetical protein